MIREYHASQEEIHYAKHLADLDLLELFSEIYVRNNRKYKYSHGKPDTAIHMVEMLEENGIYISIDKYNSWRREQNFRLIDIETRALLLELLDVTPNDYKCLVFAHVVARRKIKEKEASSHNLYFLVTAPDYGKNLINVINYPRPPCLKVLFQASAIAA